MGWFQRKGTVGEDGREVFQHAAAGGMGGLITGIASAVALVFSAISLYHSVLKQPELHFYVSPVVHYTRDANGNYEVFAIPLTIANQGARDGTVLDLELTATSTSGGESKTFYSAYVVDGDFFVPPAGFDRQKKQFVRVNRPKTPFAPISVTGRGNYSGTILFYTKGKSFPKIVADKGEYNLKISLNTRMDQSLGWIDELVRSTTKPIEFVAKLPYFSESELLRGGTHRLNNVDWSTPVAETQTKSAP